MGYISSEFDMIYLFENTATSVLSSTCPDCRHHHHNSSKHREPEECHSNLHYTASNYDGTDNQANDFLVSGFTEVRSIEIYTFSRISLDSEMRLSNKLSSHSW